MALVTYLVRTCPRVRPSSRWEPLTCKWPLVPGEKGPSTPGTMRSRAAQAGGQHHPAHLGLYPQNSSLLPGPP